MRRPVALIVAALGLACGRAEDGAVVFAAASTGDVVLDLAATSEGGVAVSLAASSTLARQIHRGAPADVFVTADPEWADWLESEGVAILDRAVLAEGRLVWVEPGAGARRASLAEAVAAAGRVALGDPAHVPAGAYARDALTEVGLWESVAARVIPQADVRAALAAVETGAADAAVVYASDARLSSRVVVTAEVPATRPIRFEAVLLTPRGRVVFEALRTEAGAWTARGFEAP